MSPLPSRSTADGTHHCRQDAVRPCLSEASACGGRTSCLPVVALRLTLQRKEEKRLGLEAPRAQQGREPGVASAKGVLRNHSALAGLSPQGSPRDPALLPLRPPLVPAARREGPVTIYQEHQGRTLPQAGVKSQGSPPVGAGFSRSPRPPPHTAESPGVSCHRQTQIDLKKKRHVAPRGLVFWGCARPDILHGALAASGRQSPGCWSSLHRCPHRCCSAKLA